MEFSPDNHIVKLCIQGMSMEENGDLQEAGNIFLQAWNEATSDHEKFISAYHLARIQNNVHDKLKWTEASLLFALKIRDDTVKSAFPALFSTLARCFEELGDYDDAKKNDELANSFTDIPSDKGPFYHGTKADLKIGDLLTGGFNSNYQSDLLMNHIYFTAMVNGAGLAAALAKGEGRERVYIVEPAGKFENDPNVTNKKFPGNPTRSYRTKEPVKIVGEVTEWMRQTPEQVQNWRDKLANSKGEIIN